MMTKREFELYFQEHVLPSVISRYEQDGIPDRPARREAWNNSLDAMIQDGQLSRRAENWGHPRWLEKRSGGAAQDVLARALRGRR